MGRKRKRRKLSTPCKRLRRQPSLAPAVRRLHVEALEDRRMLAVVTVDTNADIVDFSDGVTSLREAIFATNLVGGPDTINFDAALAGDTILLTLGELEITDELTIDATSLASALTIDAQQNSRIFDITATTGDFTFVGLTLTGGQTVDRDENGGAIRSYTTGNLTIDQSTISGNSTLFVLPYFEPKVPAANGGGIYAIGDVTISSSNISGNSTYGSGGGVISTFGSVTLTNSTVSNNSASGSTGGIGAIRNITLLNSTVSGNIASGGDGGGINNLIGDVTLTNSTVSGNTSTGGGGGILSLGNVVTLINSTVSDNSSTGQEFGGSGIFILGDVILTNSTVSGNSDSSTGFLRGGIVATAGSTTFTNSIVAGNTSNGISFDFGPFSSLQINYSLIGDTSNLSDTQLATINAGIGNIIDVDPLLGPLADNGGPTLTHALLPGSPAIDAGNPTLIPGVGGTPEFDQRGTPFSRVFGTRIDIGAVEQLGVPIIVDTLVDENDGDLSRFDVSLREAIELANTQAGTDTILFDPTLTGDTILLTLGELAITDDLTIDATSLTSNLTIDAQQNSRIANITATTGDFTFAGLTLTGGETVDDGEHGGAIRSYTKGTLTIDQSTISGNSTLFDSSTYEGKVTNGGGIFAVGTLILTDSTVSANKTYGSGGGIASGNYGVGHTSITNSTVSSNIASRNGGGIFGSAFGSVTVTNSSISDNMASGGGGLSACSMTLTNTTVSGNSINGEAASGGGIFASGDVSLVNSTISGNNIVTNTSNSSISGGGGIASRGDVALTNSTVSNNSI